MKDTIIGVDLAKRVFQVHGTSVTGQVKFRKKLTREQFRKFMAAQPACIVVFEACGSANYWVREMKKPGHVTKLIAPQYVRPFVKRQKNDAADAEAIAIAARQPEMRFVEPKTESQQAKAVLFRSRERLVHQRTELVNALQSVLYEFGYVFPIGIAQLKRIEAMVSGPDRDLPVLIIAECKDLLGQITEKTERIEEKTKALKALAVQTDTARRLQTMPGVGPLTALAVEAFAPDMAQFRCGRGFAAWLGLCTATTFIGWQRPPRAGLESRASRHSTASDHRSYDTPQLAGSQIDQARILAGPDACSKTPDAGGYCFGKQNGTANLGHADKG